MFAHLTITGLFLEIIMLKALYHAFSGKPWLLLLAFSFVISSIGNGITYIIVFSQLIHLSAPVSSLALAYVLSTVPGLAGSVVGERFTRNNNPFLVLISGECLGLLGLLIPLMAYQLNSVPLYLAAQTVSAFTIGMTFPAISKIFKTGLSADELPVATTLETIIFACNVLLGVGLGLVISNYVSFIHLLIIDVVSFVLSVIILIFSKSFFTKPFSFSNTISSQLKFRSLSYAQRRSLLLLPLLAFTGAPAMALLPGLVPSTAGFFDSQSTALILLFSRSLGQLIGPLLLNPERFEKNSNNNIKIIFSLFIFILCYGLLPIFPSVFAAVVLVIIAHIFSNVVFSLAVYSVLRHFDETQVAGAIAKSYRLQMLVTALISVSAGYCAQYFGVTYALYVFSGSGFLLVCLLSGVSYKLSTKISEQHQQ